MGCHRIPALCSLLGFWFVFSESWCYSPMTPSQLQMEENKRTQLRRHRRNCFWKIFPSWKVNWEHLQKSTNSWVSSKKMLVFFHEVACFQWPVVEIPTCTLKWWSQEILNKNTKAFPVINGPLNNCKCIIFRFYCLLLGLSGVYWGEISFATRERLLAVEIIGFPVLPVLQNLQFAGVFLLLPRKWSCHGKEETYPKVLLDIWTTPKQHAVTLDDFLQYFEGEQNKSLKPPNHIKSLREQKQTSSAHQQQHVEPPTHRRPHRPPWTVLGLVQAFFSLIPPQQFWKHCHEHEETKTSRIKYWAPWNQLSQSDSFVKWNDAW